MTRNDKAPTAFAVLSYQLTFHLVRLPLYAVRPLVRFARGGAR